MTSELKRLMDAIEESCQKFTGLAERLRNI